MPTTPPTPLGARVELASAVWLAEAERHLQSGLDRVDLPPGAQSVAVGFVYSDAPPHLQGSRNEAAFCIRIGGRTATVRAGGVDDADQCLFADYNQALAVVSTPDDGGDSVARAIRELRHRHGPDAWVTRGALNLAPALRQLLHEVHDHMARRTVTNPDLQHRIGHLGLETARESLDTHGYTILENAISVPFADEIKAALNQAIDETCGPGSHGLGANGDGAAGRLLERGRVFEEAAQHPWILALQEHIVGRGCLLSTSLGFRKEAGDVTHIVHVDYPLIEEPFPDYTLMGTTVFALDEFDESCGPTAVVPGSFRRNRNPLRDEGENDLVPVFMPKGSVAIWRGNTWHSAHTRTAPGYRVTLHQTYCRLQIRPIDGYLEIDPAILDRNGPQLTTLCGLDDLFEKSGPTGPYMEGAAYARKNYVLQGAGQDPRAALKVV